MKKILYLLSSVLLLSACSKDNDKIGIIDNINDLKYAVAVKAEIPKVEVETSPLKDAELYSQIADGNPIFYNLVVYKENGDVFYQAVYDVEHNSTGNSLYPNIFSFDGTTVTANLLLPKGNYHLAFIIHRKDSKYPNATISPLYSVNTDVTYTEDDNYNNVIYGKFYQKDPSIKDIHNGGIYYNNTDFSVETNDATQNLTMKLQPMWSYIDISIEDAKAFEVPEGTNALQFVVNPLYYGFEIKSKMATFKDERPTIVSLDSIRSNSLFKLRTTVSQTLPANDTISAKIKYLHKETDGSYTTLSSRELKLPQTSLENGFIYSINGKLGSKSMNISLGSFATEYVNIKF